MKSKRHKLIKEIIENQIIETQGELAEKLSQYDLDVTQATVSRDIKEMGLIKVPTGDGRYRYAVPRERTVENTYTRLQMLFKDSVISFDYSENLIVVKCLPGTANAVASCVDYIGWPGILGTLAGDDTFVIILKNKLEAPQMIERFYELKG